MQSKYINRMRPHFHPITPVSLAAAAGARRGVTALHGPNPGPSRQRGTRGHLGSPLRPRSSRAPRFPAHPGPRQRPAEPRPRPGAAPAPLPPRQRAAEARRGAGGDGRAPAAGAAGEPERPARTRRGQPSNHARRRRPGRAIGNKEPTPNHRNFAARRESHRGAAKLPVWAGRAAGLGGTHRRGGPCKCPRRRGEPGPAAPLTLAAAWAKSGCRGAARPPRGEEGGAGQAQVPAAPAGSAAGPGAPPAPGLHAGERLQDRPGGQRRAGRQPAAREATAESDGSGHPLPARPPPARRLQCGVARFLRAPRGGGGPAPRARAGGERPRRRRWGAGSDCPAPPQPHPPAPAGVAHGLWGAWASAAAPEIPPTFQTSRRGAVGSALGPRNSTRVAVGALTVRSQPRGVPPLPADAPLFY